MLFISSPFRVSIMGGGTDYKEYFNEYGGRSIGFAINQGCLISVNNNPNSLYKYRLVYSEIEEANCIEDLKHKMLYTLIKERNIDKIEIHYDATISKCSGLGTSSAFACALEASNLFFKKQELEEYSIAKGAIYLERELMKEFGGWQDQVFSAYGGICDIKFDNNQFYVSTIKPNKSKILKMNQNMFLIVVARDTDKHKLKENENKFNKNLISLNSFNDFYDSTSKALFNGDIDNLKLILKESNKLKQKFTSIHNEKTKYICNHLDKIECSYKVIGSGNGGSIFTFANDFTFKNILNFLENNPKINTKVIPININFSGTKIIKPFNNLI